MWFKNHFEEGHLKIRLDRALATTTWRQKFSEAVVQYLSTFASNHSMLSLCINGKAPLKFKQKIFLFEILWVKDPRCDEVINESWQEGLNKLGGSQFKNCIDTCKERLKVWNKVELGHVRRRIANLQNRLQMLESCQTSSSTEEEI